MGYGPDMFFHHFPQDDFLGKLRSGYPIGWFVDKPHDLYLQIGINTGGLSLLTVLALFACYLWQSLCLYWHAGFTDFREIAGVSIAAAVAAYLIAGIFNDSVVAVAPVFWALLGTGIGLNLTLAQNARVA